MSDYIVIGDAFHFNDVQKLESDFNNELCYTIPEGIRLAVSENPSDKIPLLVTVSVAGFTIGNPGDVVRARAVGAKVDGDQRRIRIQTSSDASGVAKITHLAFSGVCRTTVR